MKSSQSDILFQNQLKHQWKELAQSALKEKAYSSIQLEIEPGLWVDPLYTEEEVDSFPPIKWNETASWGIVERIVIDDSNDDAQWNTSITEALQHGCEVIELEISKSNIDFSDLLKDVILEIIELRIFSSKIICENARAFMQKYAQQHAIQAENMRFLCSDERVEPVTIVAGTTNRLAAMLHNMTALLRNESSWSDIFLHYEVGSHSLVEIARIRAIKLLCYAVAQELDKPLDQFPTIQAHVRPRVIENELESIIECGVKSFAAVVAGIDELLIENNFETALPLKPSDKKRVIRNIHWLLKLECNLDIQGDITNGAYWIEHCTQVIFNKAWNEFKTGGEG